VRIQPTADETVVYLRDISNRKRSEVLLRNSERRLRLLLDQVPATVWTLDLDLRFTSVVGAGSTVDGFDAEALDGQSVETILTDEATRKHSLANLGRVLQGESVRFETRHGDRWLQHHVEPLRAARGYEIIGAIGVAFDCTEMKETADSLTRLARVDALTQLPNRHALEESLGRALDGADRNGLSVIFVDVDRLKNINDTLGHHAGDDLLREFAGRLRRTVSAQSTVFRSGGDEFIIVLQTGDRERVALVAKNLQRSFAEPFACGGRQLLVTASIGSSTYPEDGLTAEMLIGRADSAMYQAKKAGRNRIRAYDASDDGLGLRRLRIEQDLYYAIARNELALLFEPIVNLSDDRVCGADAVLRWMHTKCGEILPAEFAQIAEETGISIEISRWMLREACTQAAAIRNVRGDFRISVRLSQRDLNEPGFVEFARSVLSETGLPAEALDIEIGESVSLGEHALERLRELRAVGVRIIVDDFGVSFGSLKVLPVTALKVDRAFVSGVADSPSDRAVVHAIVTLARSLDLAVIVEGVDTPEQLNYMRKLDCDFAMGRHFGSPAPPATFYGVRQSVSS
jgi:diguanylate cyclase (GGDEF)-like protein/PAS domain S-box-containing protein